ncbi:hypothetical protein [Tenacibaculum ovolyticum]|uniref:hypothetical protein n=1 Tax=Tenacibaculum ovolyticum TaxID=104270 RepID=UPI001F31405A|nr:hypothetical protein [Tenacibaculum ovolyticum]
MKKLILLFVLSIAFISCSDSDDYDTVNIQKSDLVGKWKLVAQTSKTKQTIVKKGVSTTSYINGLGKDFNFTITFIENPNTSTTQGVYTLVSTNVIPSQSFNTLGETNTTFGQSNTTQDQSGITQETHLNTIDGFDSINWSLNGGNISLLSRDNKSIPVQVIGFTGATLKLRVKFDETQKFSNSTIKTSRELIITLER